MDREKIDIDLLSENLKTLLEVKDVKQLRELADKNYPVDIAEAISKLDIKLIIIGLRLFTGDVSSEIFTELDIQLQGAIVEMMTSSEVKALFEEIYTDDFVDILDELPSNIVKKILSASSNETRMNVNEILQYDEQTAGGIMSIEYIKLKEDITVTAAIERIRRIHVYMEEVDDFFVVDSSNGLKGTISLKDLIFTDGNKIISEIMDERIMYVSTSTDQEEVAGLFLKYNLQTLPVVNAQQKLVGIVTIDDVIDIIEEEATEDIHKMAGISPTEDSYFKTSVFKMVRSRSIWLLFLMVSATLSQIVISAFMSIYGVNDTVTIAQGEVSIQTVVLVLLVPLLTVISGTAGNAGSQASTMIVRAISLHEVEPKDAGRVMWKEFRVAAITGLILISVNFVRMIIIYAVQENGDFNHKEYWYAIAVVSIAMFLTLIIAKVVGGLLPLFAKVVKLDPAVMAAPLLTTLVDALSTAIFFSVGLIFYGYLIS